MDDWRGNGGGRVFKNVEMEDGGDELELERDGSIMCRFRRWG